MVNLNLSISNELNRWLQREAKKRGVGSTRLAETILLEAFANRGADIQNWEGISIAFPFVSTKSLSTILEVPEWMVTRWRVINAIPEPSSERVLSVVYLQLLRDVFRGRRSGDELIGKF